MVHDRPLLLYRVRETDEDRVEVLPHILQPQQYAFALSPGSPLREAVNDALLRLVRRDTWAQTVERYLGE